MASAPKIQEMVVQAEQITIRVGNLTIESPKADPGNIAIGYGTTVLFDGKKPPIDVSKIELSTDADSVWMVKLTGFVRNTEESWRDKLAMV